MKSVVFGVTNSQPSASAVNFLPAMSAYSSSPNSTESQRKQVVPAAFTMSTFFVNLDTAPGTAKSYTFTIRKNSVDTAVTIAISGSNTSGTDNTHSVSFAAGDVITIGVTPSGTPSAPSLIQWNFVADSGGTHFAPLLGGSHTTTNLSTASTVYSQLTGASNGSNTWNATELNQQIICPTGGTISNLYAVSDVAPGTAKSYAITLVQNGSPSALVATVSGSNTSANDTTHSITVAAGDTLSISATPSGTPAVARYVWGLQFTPTNAGESFFGFGNSNAPSTTTTQYELPLGVGANGYSTTESTKFFCLGATEITALYAKLGTAPGGATSRTITIRQNASSSTAAVTISGSNTTGNITGQSISVAQSDTLDMMLTVGGTPAADTNGLHVGVLTFISAGGSNFNQPVSDSVTSSDSIVKAPVSSQADSVTSSDAPVKVLEKASSDSVTTSDANSNVVVSPKNDSVTTSDSSSRSPVKNASDTSSVADAHVLAPAKKPADSVTTSDSATTKNVFIRQPSDSVTSSDAAAKAIVHLVSDSVATSDNVNTSVLQLIDSYPVANEDSHYTIVPPSGGSHAAGQVFTGNGDAATQAIFSMLKTGTPSGPMTAQIWAITGTPQTAKPTGSVLATSNTVDASTLTTSDTLPVFTFPTPFLTVNGTLYAVVVDVTNVTGSGAVRIGQNTGSPTDDGNRVDYDDLFGNGWEALSSADAIFYVYGFAPNHYTHPQADSVTTSDSAVKAVVKKLADSVTATDLGPRALIKSFADSVTSSESSIRKPVKIPSDSVTSSDSALRKVQKSLADSVNSADVATTLNVFKRSFSDSVTTSDLATEVEPSQKAVSDSVTTSDSIVKKLEKGPSDSITSSDSALRKIVRGISDVVIASENTGKPLTHPLTDSVTVLEAVSKSIVKHFSDSVTTADHMSAAKHISDTITVLDRVAIFLSGQPIVVPTNDWIVIPVTGTQGQVPNVGIDSDIHVGISTDLNNRPLVGL